LEFCLRFQAFIKGNPATIQSYKIHLQDITVAKSTWIEDVLPRLNYKNVALVEIPKLKYEKLNEAVNALNRAWKSYSMGDMSNILVECRKTLVLQSFCRQPHLSCRHQTKY
jgi:hypothetical protein